jgi:hypothetical protein
MRTLIWTTLRLLSGPNFEGEIVDSRNLYTNYEVDKIIGDTVEEQVLFEGTREALNCSFSSEDTRLMLCILGRLGLLKA